MKRAIDWVFGIVSLLIGLGLGCWIAYNFIVEMQPEAKGKNPLPALGLTVLFIYVGITRLRKAMQKSDQQGPA